MLRWLDVVKHANFGVPAPEKRVEKTQDEWQAILTPEQFRVTRLHGTERAHSSDMCYLIEPGAYNCICCNIVFFNYTRNYNNTINCICLNFIIRYMKKALFIANI